MELITKLGIDWKLLVAQIVNFFILLVILYKFVYKPVLDMLDRRSKIIEKGVKDAKESEQRLREINELREKRMNEAEKEIGHLLEQAKKDAETMKNEIMTASRAQAEDLLKRARLQLAEEKEKMIAEVKAEVGAFIVKVTAKLLQREFTPQDQKKLIESVSQEMKV